MKKSILESMREASRLVRESKPAEATEAIQRALLHAPTAPTAHHSAAPQLDGAVRTDAMRAGTFSNAEGARDYELFVPATSAGGRLPLVVMLHGCTQDPVDFAAGTRMNAAAASEPCFVLYPSQPQRANGKRCWNWFRTGDQQRDRGEPSILAGMAREIMANDPIDPRRVYVAGMSAGGAMAVVMGTTYPDLFAAVGVHSGAPYGVANDVPSALRAMGGGAEAPAVRARQAMPVIVFHGDRDRTVSPKNADGILAAWLPERARTEEERGQVPGGHAFTRTRFRDDSGRVRAERWLVHGGGHAWSGGDRGGSYADPGGPDATREMLRFFAEWTGPARP